MTIVEIFISGTNFLLLIPTVIALVMALVSGTADIH
jgi:hypothetical protein